MLLLGFATAPCASSASRLPACRRAAPDSGDRGDTPEPPTEEAGTAALCARPRATADTRPEEPGQRPLHHRPCNFASFLGDDRARFRWANAGFGRRLSRRRRQDVSEPRPERPPLGWEPWPRGRGLAHAARERSDSKLAGVKSADVHSPSRADGHPHDAQQVLVAVRRCSILPNQQSSRAWLTRSIPMAPLRPDSLKGYSDSLSIEELRSCGRERRRARRPVDDILEGLKAELDLPRGATSAELEGGHGCSSFSVSSWPTFLSLNLRRECGSLDRPLRPPQRHPKKGACAVACSRALRDSVCRGSASSVRRRSSVASPDRWPMFGPIWRDAAGWSAASIFLVTGGLLFAATCEPQPLLRWSDLGREYVFRSRLLTCGRKLLLL